MNNISIEVSAKAVFDEELTEMYERLLDRQKRNYNIQNGCLTLYVDSECTLTFDNTYKCFIFETDSYKQRTKSQYGFVQDYVMLGHPLYSTNKNNGIYKSVDSLFSYIKSKLLNYYILNFQEIVDSTSAHLEDCRKELEFYRIQLSREEYRFAMLLKSNPDFLAVTIPNSQKTEFEQFLAMHNHTKRNIVETKDTIEFFNTEILSSTIFLAEKKFQLRLLENAEVSISYDPAEMALLRLTEDREELLTELGIV